MERYCSEAFWKKSAKQARDHSPIIYELFCLENSFPSMHVPTTYYHLQLAFDAIHGQILTRTGYTNRFVRFQYFKRECISCFCLNCSLHWYIYQQRCCIHVPNADILCMWKIYLTYWRRSFLSHILSPYIPELVYKFVFIVTSTW
jgi:hypothetical protein